MSKHAITREVKRELKKINDRIDHAIITGRSYAEEARRHRELLVTLARLTDREAIRKVIIIRPTRRSPVRRSLMGSVFSRFFLSTASM